MKKQKFETDRVIKRQKFYLDQEADVLDRSTKCGVTHAVPDSKKLLPQLSLKSLEELLERDKLREQDGFPRKIKLGKISTPVGGSPVIVPTTTEEKFYHGMVSSPNGESSGGGAGEGEDGEIIGEQPLRPEQGQGSGPGDGQGGSHDLESSAYNLGRVLSEQFELPNLQDKGNKKSLTKYTWDLTDTNRGNGQVLDKKATLKQILKTNMALGRISDIDNIDTTELITVPRDKVYRVLSQEKEFESQAVVFFLRDYSGSMQGKCTDLVCSQHVMIYSWLLFQYKKRVETRFILHDTDAREVPDFDTYYNSAVAGGTKVSAAYKLLNQIVADENLARDNNIYVFGGTDGDDWDSDGKETIPELEEMLQYVARAGVTVVKHAYSQTRKTEVEKYLENSGLLEEKSDLLKMDVMSEDADEPRIIDGIRTLVSQ
jgi:uncharacterized protein